MKYFFISLFLLAVFVFIYFWGVQSQKQISYTVYQPEEPSVTPNPTRIPPTPTPKPVSGLIYIPVVPFAAQAPFGNWGDPTEQNGCEEAAAVIAVYWAKNRPLTLQGMLDEIVTVSAYEDNKYGNSVDTSAADTVGRLINGYFKYPKARAEKVTDVGQLINWLNAGYLLITPMDGRLVGNAYYTAPGPERHMIVIRGYDPKTGEFITNDAGTRQGENYRYPKTRFFTAIRDYPTGDHLPFTDTSSKSAILVWK